MQVIKALGLVSLSAAVGLSAGDAGAVLFGFEKIDGNGNPDVASQLFVDVTDSGSNTVTFKFTNNVGIASSITDIYFDDGTLLGIATVTNGPLGLVDFSAGATPGELPGANQANPDFVTS